MQPHPFKKNLMLASVGAVLLFSLVFMTETFLLNRFPLISVLLGFICIVFIQFLVFHYLDLRSRELYEEINNGAAQSIAAQSLIPYINPDFPLPKMRNWASSPDLMTIYAQIIKNNAIKNIVECGGGVSSIIGAYLLEKKGGGHIYSLEHDAPFADESEANVAAHGKSHLVDILRAPIKNYTIKGKSWKWYDIAGIPKDIKIDLILVDGPPSILQKNARYPAVPLLLDQLSENAVVLVDDCIRDEDKASVEQWVKELDGFQSKWFYTDKGTYVVWRGKNPFA